MPLLNSEDWSDVNDSIEFFEKTIQKVSCYTSDVSRFLQQNLKTARKNMEILEKFGRFPSRNQALGRESTPEELEFLS